MRWITPICASHAMHLSLCSSTNFDSNFAMNETLRRMRSNAVTHLSNSVILLSESDMPRKPTTTSLSKKHDFESTCSPCLRISSLLVGYMLYKDLCLCEYLVYNVPSQSHSSYALLCRWVSRRWYLKRKREEKSQMLYIKRQLKTGRDLCGRKT